MGWGWQRGGRGGAGGDMGVGMGANVWLFSISFFLSPLLSFPPSPLHYLSLSYIHTHLNRHDSHHPLPRAPASPKRRRRRPSPLHPPAGRRSAPKAAAQRPLTRAGLARAVVCRMPAGPATAPPAASSQALNPEPAQAATASAAVASAVAIAAGNRWRCSGPPPPRRHRHPKVLSYRMDRVHRPLPSEALADGVDGTLLAQR